jgi:hypothetical protein
MISADEVVHVRIFRECEVHEATAPRIETLASKTVA